MPQGFAERQPCGFLGSLESLTDDHYDRFVEEDTADFRRQWVESGRSLDDLEERGRLVLQKYPPKEDEPMAESACFL